MFLDDIWATKSEYVGLIVHAISFQDFQPMWSWSSNVTDRQSDRRTDDMRSQDRALHYSASRGKKGQETKTWHVSCLPRPRKLLQRHLVLHAWSYPDAVIYSRFHWNPSWGFWAQGGRKSVISITLASGFYYSCDSFINRLSCKFLVKQN